MEYRFSASTTYDEKSIHAIAKANYHLYQPSAAIRLYAVGAGLLILGLFGSSFLGESLSFIALLIGCVVIANGEYPARITAKNMISQLKQNMPELNLSFFNDYIGVTVSKKNAKIKYSDIEKLAENKEYYFLFLGPNNAYVFKKNELCKGNAYDFKKFLQEKTGRTFEAPRNALVQILVFKSFKKKR